jgi:hypothetical protein
VTVRDLLTRSLRQIGVLAAGERLTDDQASDGLDTINDWLDAARTESLLFNQSVRTTHALTANQSSYTVGVGGDVNIAAPAYLDALGLLNTAVTPQYERMVAGPISESDWQVIPQKGLTATEPHTAYYVPSYPLGALYLYPVPTNDLTLVVYAPGSPLASVASLDTTISVPRGWMRMLVTNLAVELAPEYGKPPDPVLLQRAAESKAAVKRAQTPIPAPFPSGAAQYDIQSDRTWVR